MTVQISNMTRDAVSSMCIDLDFSAVDRAKFLHCTALSSEVFAGLIDGHVIAVWGLIPPSLLSDRAYLWLYTTESLSEHQFTFVRQSQIMVERMLKEYKTIVGHVHMDAAKSKRWLQWLGARFGKHNGKLLEFSIVRGNG